MPLRRSLPGIAALLAAALLPMLAYFAGNGVMVHVPMVVHFIAITAAGLLAAAAAVGMSMVSVRRNDGRAVLLGFAFSVMAVLLVLHALATPGVLIGDNGLVQAAGALNVPIGGAILFATALPRLRRPLNTRRLLHVQLATLAGLLTFGAAALIDPTLAPEIPKPGTLVAGLVFIAGTPMLALLADRAGRTFLLTHRRADALVGLGVVLLWGAEFGLLHYGMMDLGWWTAHALEVAGIGLVGIPAALDLRHATASRPLIGDLRGEDIVADEEAFLGGRVHALLRRLAEKDGSTEGHTRRVATLAVQIGEQLGLSAHRLRLLALGGLLHDMGKLTIPDEILNKPGKLIDEEFAVIKSHPAAGRELLVEIGGFPQLVLDLVESHHERLDGRGYPNGVEAGRLALEVRILTVADVYDALTADRVYREAWPLERALSLLVADTGTAFDEQCVAALKAVVAPPEWQATLAAAQETSKRPSQPLRIASS